MPGLPRPLIVTAYVPAVDELRELEVGVVMLAVRLTVEVVQPIVSPLVGATV